MKLQRQIIVTLFFLGLNNLHAQTAIPAAGGAANGSGGSASYTIGQSFYTTHTGTNGYSIIEGIQQAHEIYTVTGIPQAAGINLNVLAYPNPATEYLIVKIKGYETANLQFRLFDMDGKLLQNIKATGTETRIETSNFIPAIYFIKIIDKQKVIKVFKIIKN